LKFSNDCDIDYRQSKNKRLLVELTLIRLCQLTDEKKKSLIIDEKPAPIQNLSAAVAVPAAPAAVNTVTLQPQVIEKTKPATTEHIPVPQRPGSISISAPQIVSAPQEEYSTAKAQEIVLPENPFTNEDVEIAWRQFADTIPDQGRIASFILNNKPYQTAEKTFEVTVSNILQEKELKRILPDILTFIHTNLSNATIRMTIKIMEETEKQRGNSPEERFKIMAEQNSALNTLRTGLNLEID
jgi:DNA polymerase-3 subunit gamma/tau